MDIVRQLKQIVVILLVFAIVNVSLLYLQSYQMTKDERVVNFSGIVRGASQKLIKNELANNHNDQQIKEIEQIIQGLIYGDQILQLPPAKSKHFIEKIKIVEKEWQFLKEDIQEFRNKKNTAESLLKMSEKFWYFTNEATFTSEKIAFKKVDFMRKIYLFLFLLNIIVLVIIWLMTRKITKNIKARLRAEIFLRNSEKQLNKQNIELTEKTKQVEEANKAKMEFLANMSHELRTPLSSILGFSDLLRDKITDSKSLQYVDYIMSSGEKLLALINGILDIAKLESGKLKLHYESVNLRNIITQLPSKFTKQARNKNLNFLVNIDENTPDIIEFDSMRLYQIIDYIIDNAIKFTQVGTVTINVSSSEVKSSNNHQPKYCFIIIKIQDTGIGISAEKQAIIFDIFRQVSGEINRKYEGVGIGLTITQRLMQLLGGTIEIESELGKGSTFTLIFPSVKVIQSSSHVALTLTLDTELTNTSENSKVIALDINLEQLSELLEKLHAYEVKCWPQVKQTLSTRDIKKLISLLIEWGHEYKVSHLSNYAKKLNHALEELDIDILHQLLEDFPELRNYLLNQLC